MTENKATKKLQTKGRMYIIVCLYSGRKRGTFILYHADELDNISCKNRDKNEK